MMVKCILWQNGMVMAFDDEGQQIPYIGQDQIQGHYEEVRDNVFKHAGPLTMFAVGVWGTQPFVVDVTREGWEGRCR